MSASTVVLIALGYAALLFGGAFWAHRRRDPLARSGYRLPAYALALAVYCTSWTYYGAVGTAAAAGWNYLPIYLGPITLFLFGGSFLHRLVATVREEGATSLSDFIGSRFGKSKGLAALVTIIALAGTIPYLALQLRSVGGSYAVLSAHGDSRTAIVAAAIILAPFGIIFGTRRYGAGPRNEAILFVVAAESVVKLLALVAIGLFAATLLFGWEDDAASWSRFQATFPVPSLLDFSVITMLAMLAIICLPRQFYIAVTQASDPNDIVRARYPFIAYLLVTIAVVIPVTLTGLTLLPNSPPDFFVLSLPMASGATILTIAVFLGGLSAAAAMALAECIALSTMVSNDLVAPFVLRNRAMEDADLGRIMLLVRRVAILLLLGSATLYALYIPPRAQLASVGLVAFAALAQAAPALLVAVYRTDGSPMAAKTGLAIGLVIWGYTLFLPGAGMDLAPYVPSVLHPDALFGIKGLTHITHGTLWSLGGNIAAFGAVTLWDNARPRLTMRFARQKSVGSITTMRELIGMVSRFVGPEAARQAFAGQAASEQPIDSASARRAERLIAGVVGAPSAHAIMASALSGSSLNMLDIARMLDASSQSLHFSRELLAATLEHIEPGVSVVDADLRLIAWNTRYLELFSYPPGMVRIGASVAELIRYNAVRGECGPGEVDDHVAKRISHMRGGRDHSFERRRPDGRVLRTVGGPMPGGGYVMCFTDITSQTEARESLEDARAQLEQRVVERTAELSRANEKLAAATAEKTRFLAAASHDLLQPLHAARLFTASMQRDLPDKLLPTLHRIDRSIEAANDLLRALLDISRLDAGGITPDVKAFPLGPMLDELVESFEPLAAERGLRLRRAGSDVMLLTDPTLLRSIVQNFLSNAVRYTQTGGIFVAVRVRQERVRIEVYDSGPGIPAEKQALIFREFERAGTGNEPGVGLGLAIVERTAALLGARIELQSHVGRGSRFSVVLPHVGRVTGQGAGPDTPALSGKGESLSLLVVDDDPSICDAMALLLGGMGHQVRTATNAASALAMTDPFDAALIDFDLGDGMDGLQLIDTFGAHGRFMSVALVTADTTAAVKDRARAAGVVLLPKPLSVDALGQWLATV